MKNNGRRFLDFIPLLSEEEIDFDHLAGSFAVIQCKGKYLLCYNVWREQWEIPAGSREGNETPMECAKRELYEETGQRVNKMELKGILKSQNLQDGSIINNPVYYSVVSELQPFLENKETSAILLWDLQEKIGPLDEVDIKIFDYIRGW
ncbi:NUDIX domain-containing protein [Paucisalibacillus globulus]|uniref:NUDIX domain-containing protein n=1 Tax=Paucisalibacillus globulus TaxID=351095 RepID=UPI00055BE8F4|nr:NUDIX hydrolase [Paucisalibacillus globulus]